MTNLAVGQSDYRIAGFAALAIVIHVAEAALPSPLPGIKPGLANVITVLVLLRWGWREAAWVALLRILVGSLVVGTFLSPTFILSLGGGMAALLAMLPFVWLGSYFPALAPGPVGFSLLASLAHMAAQFGLAYSIYIPHPSLLGLFPVFMTAALVFGLISGTIAHSVIKKLES